MTAYAWTFRYPGEVEEADEAVAVAREVYEAILTRLPAEVRP